MSKTYYVYMLTNRTGSIYVGVTNDLARRLWEHRSGLVPGFTQRYNMDRLIYYEAFDRVEHAIDREKQIKRWRREKKLNLIATVNPDWRDLGAAITG